MDRRHLRRIRAVVFRPVLELAILVARLLPWRAVQRLGRATGHVAWWLSGVNRRRALDHLAIAFPERPAGARKALAREAFRQQMMNALEYFHLSGKGLAAAERHIRVEGWEHIERARVGERPAVVITGHCGNWELLGAVFGSRRVPLTAVVRGLKEKQFEPMLERMRDVFGTRQINRGEPGAARELLAALRAGSALLMLIDQDVRTDGVFVPFFGKLAHTPSGAARLALKRRAPAIPAFAERLEDGSHLVRFAAPLDLPSDPVAATAIMTRAIEDQVRRRPEQWVWWHRRWRHRPPEEPQPTSAAAPTPSR